MGRLSRRSLRDMTATEAHTPTMPVPTMPVPVMPVPVIPTVAHTVAGSDCLYAPYPCHMYRSHAPAIWCSSCRVRAISQYAQNGMRVDCSIFNPPAPCVQPCAPLPLVQEAPCPLRYYRQPPVVSAASPQNIVVGAGCVVPIIQQPMCPTSVVSCPSVW